MLCGRYQYKPVVGAFRHLFQVSEFDVIVELASLVLERNGGQSGLVLGGLS